MSYWSDTVMLLVILAEYDCTVTELQILNLCSRINCALPDDP